MAGSTAKHLNVRDLRSLTIPVPPLEAQERFVGRIATIEDHKAAAQRGEKRMDALFASLQQRAFRGEL